MSANIVGVQAIAREKRAQTVIFTQIRFLVDIPWGEDVFVYPDGRQTLSESVKRAWHEQYGEKYDLQAFVIG